MRHALWLILAGFCVGGEVVCAASGSPPNVLWIVCDDLSTDMGCYEQPVIRTPNIDRLASRSVRFSRAYAQFALCNPSRSSFLSGYGPDRTTIMTQEKGIRKTMPEAMLLPGMFRKAGYFVAGHGKIHHGKHTAPDSWDEYEDLKGKDPDELRMGDERGANKEDRTPYWFALQNDGGAMADGIHTQVVVDLLKEKSAKPQPFFIALGLHKPHVPWVAPKKFFDLYHPPDMPKFEQLTWSGIPQIALMTEWPVGTRPKDADGGVAAYYSCVSFTDSNIGKVLQAMDQLKLWENTIVVMMGDHGFHLGDHHLWSKMTLFDRSLRVPFMIATPGNKNAGRSSHRTVQLMDLYPTLADLSGLKAPADLSGHSLRPLLENPDAAWDHPAFSTTLHEQTIGRSIRTERWRYTEWADGKQGYELYDHTTDPLELNNLAEKAEHTAIKNQLAARLQEWRGK